MTKTSLYFSLILCCCLIGPAGCRKQELPAGMPPLSPVVLTFTVDGQPLVKGDVKLVDQNNTNKWAIGGVTDENGVLTVMTQGIYNGAPQGDYAVCVTKVRDVPGPSASEPKPSSQGEYMAWCEQCTKELEQFLVVGTDYNQAETTPLTLTVKKGKNSETFDIPEDGTQIKFAE